MPTVSVRCNEGHTFYATRSLLLKCPCLCRPNPKFQYSTVLQTSPNSLKYPVISRLLGIDQSSMSELAITQQPRILSGDNGTSRVPFRDKSKALLLLPVSADAKIPIVPDCSIQRQRCGYTSAN